MRFIISAGPGSQANPPQDAPFSEDLFAAYMKYNEDMTRAGVLIASEGLNPAGGRARVGVKDGKRRLIDGPFAETKELLGGFYLIEVDSLQDAIAWALRCPVGMHSADQLDIHQLTEGADIPQELRDLIGKVAPTWSQSFTRSKSRQEQEPQK